MIHYQAPLNDIQFLLFDVLKSTDRYRDLPIGDDFSQDLVASVLIEMGKFVEGVFLPTNRSGDEEGCQYDPETRSVKAPESFHSAFKQFVEGGWPSLSAPTEHGGQGLPHLLNVVFDELCASTNTSLSMYFGLTHGAIVALDKHADDDLKSAYIEQLISGEWTGTMCLTEPQCGTDLGLIKTKAVPMEDKANTYQLSGAKIWITGGEHDLTDNIIHLVLAKLPDAPEGTKGISLFIVPKVLPDGSRNGIYCTGLEHKMGINGSATCFISLEEAEGYLIGEPHQGLKYMFSMMNSARIMVGVQGLGLGETAYQTALAFAKDRAQGRSLAGPKEPDQPADNILVHPDVRRMLLSQKAMLEGCRALAYWVGMNLDLSHHHPDADAREKANDLVELLTPVVKAFITDQGYLACDQAIQTLGGSGYTKDWGIEQLLRDSRIARIYEGTNGIQALDLVGRKLPMHNGRAVKHLIAEIVEFANHCRDHATQAKLRHAVSVLSDALGWLTVNALQDREIAGAVATPILKLFGVVTVGYLLAKSGQAAQDLLDNGDTREQFLMAKLKTRDYFFAEPMLEADTLLQLIKAGKQHLMAFDAEDF